MNTCSQTPTQSRGYAKRCLSHRLTIHDAKRLLCLTVLLARGSIYFQPLHTRLCGKHWFMLVSSSLTAARPFPAFTGFSYIASTATRYSVLPHKALPTKNIVNNSGHCHPRGFHSASTMPATMATAPAIATTVICSPSAITAVTIVTSGIA